MIKISSILAIAILFISCNSTNYKHKQTNSDDLRIISLVPSVTKDLVSLNLSKYIVGATTYCDISATNNDLIVGTAIDVNIEKILLLEPTIVFASGLIKQKDISSLQNNDIKVHMLNKMHSYNEICNHLIDIGKIVGKTELAQSIVNKSKLKIDSLINTIPPHADSLSVFFQIGTKPIFGVIPDSFMDDYITMAGCKNILSDLEHGTVTRESVIKYNPDVIFITIMGIVGGNEKGNWENYPVLKSVKNRNIFVIDAKLATSPTVISFTETFEQVVNYIYK